MPLAIADEWPQVAGDAAHSGTTFRAARTLGTPRWTVVPLADEEFITDSSPVVGGGAVLVLARRYENNAHVGDRLVAFDVYDGQRLWATPLEADALDSWSSPAIDLRTRAAFIAVGSRVYACALEDGHVVWSKPLERIIVNASPIVTDDLESGGTPANRVFITDCAFSGSAKLYALNVDPYDAIHNPYQPGEIAWSIALPGASGSTPAYADGVVYALSMDGLVFARRAIDGGFVWQTQVDFSVNPQYTGFYGGVALHGDAAYAASYCFYGEGNNSRLYKFDRASGAIIWEIPSERTNSMPVATDDGRIFLAAGLTGYGSAIKIQAFQDYGTTATFLWDTYVDTGGTLITGGWSAQPAYSRGYLYTGRPIQPGTGMTHTYLEFNVLDTTVEPSDPDFLVARAAGSGGSPAVADGTVYSMGVDGLLAFDPSPACLADLDGDTVVDLGDLAELLGRYGARRWDLQYDSAADLNRDGVINLSDLAALLGSYGAPCE